MTRKLSQDERLLWDSVTKSVKPLDSSRIADPLLDVNYPTMQLSPSPVLDLHGMTLTEAHRATLDHVRTVALDRTHRYVMIITGLSGQIFEEFPRWLENHCDVRQLDPVRGGGSWKVWLRKKNT